MGDNEDLAANLEEPGQDEAAAPKTGFSIGDIFKWLLDNLIPVIIAVVISTIIAFIIVRASVTQKGEETIAQTTLIEKEPPKKVYKLAEFKLNTADVDEPHFVRITISLAYNADSEKVLGPEIAEREAQIRDIIFGVINAKKKEDLDTIDEKEQLKDEIIKNINNVLKNGSIEAIFIDEFVVS